MTDTHGSAPLPVQLTGVFAGQVSLGVVGPASGADAVQRWWHSLKIFGGQQPEGWHSQIKDEPGFILTGQRT